MVVRMRHVKKLTGRDFRLTLDVVDPERAPWDYGDCVVQIDLHDGLGDHFSNPRGLLKPAFEAYGLSSKERPVSVVRPHWDRRVRSALRRATNGAARRRSTMPTQTRAVRRR